MILLFNPWSTPSPKKPLPMSLLAIGSMLEGEFDYRFVDGNIDADPVGSIIDLKKQTRIRAICVTVMPGPQLRAAVIACRELKSRLPNVPIIWGGYFASQHVEACLSEDTVDVCVIGQGETTIVELMRAITRGGPLSEIAGLAYRENRSIRRTGSRALTP